MASIEDRERHSRRRKKNIYAKVLKDPGDMKGAFALKVVNPKKNSPYKRERINIKEMEINTDD